MPRATKDRKLYVKIRTCRIKHKYASEAEAAKGWVDETRSVYKCPYCDGWHRTGKHINWYNASGFRHP